MDRLKNLTQEEKLMLKEKAVVYFANNGVPKKMEEALNSMFYDSPSDVFGYLVNYFKKCCVSPTVESVTCKTSLTNSGEISTAFELRGKFANVSCLYGSVIMTPLSILDPSGDGVAEQNAAKKFVTEQVPTFMKDHLDMQSAFKKSEFDDFLYNCMRDKERMVEREWRVHKQAELLAAQSESTVTVTDQKKGGGGKAKTSTATKRPAQNTVEQPPRTTGISVVSTLSKLFCLSVARSMEVAPFNSIKQLPLIHTTSEKQQNIMPLVVFSQNGRTAPGKLKCFKELFVIVNPSRDIVSILEDTTRLFDIFRTKAFAKATSGTARLATEIGAISPQMDRPEQLLDLLVESCLELTLRPGVDVFFGINCAAQDLYDSDKGKYEFVVGALRVPEDAADFWSDLITRYPIAVLIDPLRKEDVPSWVRLGEKVAGKCFIFADQSLGSRLDHFAMGESPEPPLTADPNQPQQPSEAPETTDSSALLPSMIPTCANGVVLRMDGSSLMTVSAAAKIANYLYENNYLLMVAASPTSSQDNFDLDLALALRAHSFHVGGINRGERANLLNTWHSYTTDHELKAPALTSALPSERAALASEQA